MLPLSRYHGEGAEGYAITNQSDETTLLRMRE